MDSFLDRRNGAIDMLRGLTMFLMVFVNDLWTVGTKTENIDRLTANQLDELFRGLDLEGCERLDMLCVRCDNNVA